MGLTRRQFIFSVVLTSGAPHLLASRSQALTGKMLGLTTLNSEGEEISELFSLDLATGSSEFRSLSDYRFGHSLEPLTGNRWLAIPYGDDNQACLVLDSSGHPIRELAAPSGYGFGGHAAVMKDSEHVFLHYNESERNTAGSGRAALVNTQNGKVVAEVSTSIIHGHDIILASNGQIVVADDGVIDSLDDAAPFQLERINPALYFYNADLSLARTVLLPINGSLVHITEDAQHSIIGAVEQYVLLNEAGRKVIQDLFGASAEDFLNQFDPEVFELDVPIPGAIMTVKADGEMLEQIANGQHLDPFDMQFNPNSGTTCCVFTESNVIAWQQGNAAWRYLKLDQFGMESPFGLTNLGSSSLMAVNGFHRGVAILDTRDMSLARYYDVPTQGVKHLNYAGSPSGGD